MSERGDEPKRESPNKMTREEAERLRALLRDTRPADYRPSPLQRVGIAIAQAIYRGPEKPGSRDTKKD